MLWGWACPPSQLLYIARPTRRCLHHIIIPTQAHAVMCQRWVYTSVPHPHTYHPCFHQCSSQQHTGASTPWAPPCSTLSGLPCGASQRIRYPSKLMLYLVKVKLCNGSQTVHGIVPLASGRGVSLASSLVTKHFAPTHMHVGHLQPLWLALSLTYAPVATHGTREGWVYCAAPHPLHMSQWERGVLEASKTHQNQHTCP